MALRLTRALHSYARAGRTVIASMKQPSNRMFSFFTHLLLTAEGNPIYYGPASTALSYFDSCGFSPSPDSSPAEFFLVRGSGRLCISTRSGVPTGVPVLTVAVLQICSGSPLARRLCQLQECGNTASIGFESLHGLCYGASVKHFAPFPVHEYWCPISGPDGTSVVPVAIQVLALTAPVLCMQRYCMLCCALSGSDGT